MYPNQPQYPAPAQPQYPQQPAPAAPQYPPAQPQFPQQFAPVPQPQYQGQPQQFAPGYPQAAPMPQSPPLAAGTLDGFFSQPTTGGGKSLTFNQIGESYTGIVTRPITNGDIQQQTDTQGRPQTFRDGRPKYVMKVPLQMQPTAAYPDGLAQWYVKGAARDELVRAMSEAGAPEGPPEAGSVIQVTHTAQRPSGPGMNPSKLFQVVYRRPSSAGQAPAAQPVSAAPAPQPVQQPVPSALVQAAAPEMAQVQAANPVAQMPVPQQVPTQPMQQVPVQQPAPAGEMSPEQQALLAQLTGQ